MSVEEQLAEIQRMTEKLHAESKTANVTLPRLYEIRDQLKAMRERQKELLRKKETP